MNKTQNLMIDDILRYTEKVIKEESWDMSKEEFKSLSNTLQKSIYYLLNDLMEDVASDL